MKAIEETRKLRELESQQRQAKLRKLREDADREQKRIESVKTEIRKTIEDAAGRGYYEAAVGGTELQFDFMQWHNPFHILTGRAHLLSPTSADNRAVMETFRLCESLGFKPFLKLLRQLRAVAANDVESFS